MIILGHGLQDDIVKHEFLEKILFNNLKKLRVGTMV